MPHFLTSPERLESSSKHINQSVKTCESREILLRAQISNLIAKMPSHEICLQAALNIGLATSITDFEKLLKRMQGQENVNILSFSLMQLKPLFKEANKLKEIANYGGESMVKDLKSSMKRYQWVRSHKQTLDKDFFEQQKKVKTDQQKMIAAINDEIAFRIKVKKFYSTQKIEKKDHCLKKKAQKAKNLNKKALKVFKNYKQKEQRSFELFKTSEPIFTPQQKSDVNVATPSISVKNRVISKDQPEQFQQLRFIFDYNESPTKCKTAAIGRRKGLAFKKLMFKFQKNDNDPNEQRFAELHRRQLETRQRRKQIQNQKEEKIIFKLIKKHKKMKNISNADNNSQLKAQKENKKQKEVIIQQSIAKNDVDQLQLRIKEKCQQKQVKKYLQLQQRVNRIREELKVKQDRMERYRYWKQQDNEQKILKNEEYFRSYMAKIKEDKEKEANHEITIKNRHQEIQQKQKYNKILQRLSRLPDQILNKQLDRLKQNQLNKQFKSATCLRIN